MSDEKNPLEQAVDQAVDAFVYAPIGLLFDGPALFPKLVERGKNQVNVARMMGQMAVQMGQAEAGKRLASTQGPVRDALETVGLVAPAPKAAPVVAVVPDPVVADEPVAAKATPAARATKTARSTAKRASTTAAKATSTAAKATSAAAATIGIPDYDSLSASQVVTRLRGLAPKELDAVKAYEGATRARKTILNRVSQLQKG